MKNTKIKHDILYSVLFDDEDRLELLRLVKNNQKLFNRIKLAKKKLITIDEDFQEVSLESCNLKVNYVNRS